MRIVGISFVELIGKKTYLGDSSSMLNPPVSSIGNVPSIHALYKI